MQQNREVITGAHWGVFHAQTAGQRVVGARPFDLDPQPSAMLAATADLAHSPLRIKKPAVRKSYLQHGPGSATDRRGKDPFIEVSWDQALDLIHRHLSEQFAEHGNESLFAGSYGWASAGKFHSAPKQLHRFLNQVGGFTFHKGNYSAGAITFLAPHIIGDPWFLFAPSSYASMVGKTELMVTFGGLPTKNMQADQGGVGVHDALSWLDRLKTGGTRFINIGPLASDLDRAYQDRWLACRPNSDTALMLALCHTLYTEKLCDHEFLHRYTTGFEKVVPYLTGEQDGLAKNAEWAAQLTEVPAAQIRQLAREMAASRTMINLALSLQRADHGEQPYWAALLLAAMVGDIGLAGGGIGFGYGTGAGVGVPRQPIPAAGLPIGNNPVERFIPVARISDMLLEPGKPFSFNGGDYQYPDIEAIWWAGGNPFHHHQDLNRLLQAWRKPKTIIVNDPWWTSTARHADIVLPATTTLERNDIGGSNFLTDRFLFAMQQAIPPQHQARNEYDIYHDLACRFGVETEFTEGRDEMGWLNHLYNQTRDTAQERGMELPEFEQFWQQGYYEAPPPPEPYTAFAEFRRDPTAAPLKTPSGCFELYSETIAKFGYDDCPGHPVWLEPAEWLGSQQADQFPLHLVSNQPQGRLHSQFDPGRVSQQSKISGLEPISMNPADAAERALQPGDAVEVFNNRGRLLAGVVISEALRPGVVQMSTGAWFLPQEPGEIGALDPGGNVNMVTLDKGTSPLSQAPIAQSALVEVKKAREPVCRPDYSPPEIFPTL
ncbi:MAG TPA: Asp-tRNA(Asn)/Glu-tRNA(Gln) amidotransferase GatCAB subunit C [Gammaproteobacteria bacterium]|nr:Asp-tRNA(Asn)/Glu-tRNA(Gln) amidotransferase GatCAB subunit C [Gammaproteobacteria bacterium]